jgi:hypothetical protein
LVFFLGGIAEFERDPGTGKEVPGRPIILHGFTDNPRNPGGVPDASNPATMARIDPFFDFEASRLLIRTPVNSPEDDAVAEFFDFNSQRPRPANKLPSYRSRLSPPDTETPYAYFSSYDGMGYRANDCNFIDEPGTQFQERWPTVTTSSTPHPFSPGPNPYTVTEAAPPNDSNVAQAYEPRKYQIIAPGPDGEYGTGGSLGVATVELTEADKDNISNVTEGIAIGEHHRVHAK